MFLIHIDYLSSFTLIDVVIIKITSIDVQPRQLAAPCLWDLYHLLPNLFLFFCNDLTVLIFRMLLADIQRPN